ncbi:hypothetical protein SAMN02745166_02243 [Prosthecobacter debontii]|uniref:Uncharacterized protein n=1 Tax=Prosthecobacter debontii TaxID=48467 RepID=A0A1T4XZD5_9BACT|nr:hypothetical protein [Prosthecobacter debontii]SKA94922.1 hypothetical protein SAMN02745166_02243 [Prosthecobacter debontii]
MTDDTANDAMMNTASSDGAVSAPVSQESVPAAPASESPEAFDFHSILGKDGSFTAGWQEALPEDLREYAAEFGKYPNAMELLRGHANKAKMIGQRTGVKPPGAEAKPEEIAAWRKALGVPETAEGYGIAKPEALPEGVQWDEGTVKEFQTLAHDLHLTPHQVQSLMAFDLKQKEGLVSRGREGVDSYLNEQRTLLEAEWGDRIHENTARALRAAQLLGLDPDDAEIGNSAKMIRALHSASVLMQEDRLLGSRSSTAVMGGEAQAEDIRRNPNNPWHKAYLGHEGKERQQEAAEMIRKLRGV